MHRRRSAAVAVLALVAASWAAPPAARGLTTPTISVAAHRPDHGTGTTVAIGTLVHLQVSVRHNGQPVPGKVLIVFFEGHGCTGFSYTGEAIDLVNGEIDGARPYGFSEPAGGSFGARYLGSGDWGPVSAPCVDVTWKAPLDALTSHLHDPAHVALPPVVAVGTQAHLLAVPSGSWGLVEGRITIYRYANATCSGSGTLHQSFSGDLGAFIDVAAQDHRYTAPGTYAWQAYFNNSDVYLVKTGTCHVLTVKAGSSASARLVDSAGSPIGQLPAGSDYYVRGGATGDFGTPSGQGAVNFHTQPDCGGVAFPEPVTLANGTFQLGPRNAQVPGYRSLRFSYLGDGTYFPSSSACVNLTVVATPSTGPTLPPPTAPPSAPPSAPPTASPTAGPTLPNDPATTPPSSGSPTSPATGAPGATPSSPEGTTGTGAPIPGASGPAASSPDPAAPLATPGGPTLAPGATAAPGGPHGSVGPDAAGAPVAEAGPPADGPWFVAIGVGLAALVAGLAIALLVRRRTTAGHPDGAARPPSASMP